MALAADFARMQRRDGDGAAIAMVEQRAAAGDADALLLIGEWRLWGAFGPQDLTAGYGLVLEAAKRGHIPAIQVLAALLATGTGLPRDAAKARAIVEASAAQSKEAAEQVRVAATAPAAIGQRQVLRDDPLVARIDGLLSAQECAYLIARAKPKVQPSVVIDPQGRSVPNPIRDSHGANFAPVEEDLVIHAINCRIAAATGTEWEQGEPLHILRYEPGQQYRKHFDALPGVRNQRVLTCLVYLNDGFDGGATAFTEGLEVKGGTGDAVIFANTTPDGRADQRTEHAGLPVTKGVKWLATRWIRAGRHHPWEPETMM